MSVERAEQAIRETIGLHERLLEQALQIADCATRLADVLREGGTIYVIGNGGSAADAQHMAGEIVGRFMIERPGLPCHALTADTSVLTSVANDYGFEAVFRRQVEAHVSEGDALVAISTSGNSPNVAAAVELARERGALTIALTGRDGGQLAGLCDEAVVVPADLTPRIQSAHGTVIHIWCDLIERDLFSSAD